MLKVESWKDFEENNSSARYPSELDHSPSGRDMLRIEVCKPRSVNMFKRG